MTQTANQSASPPVEQPVTLSLFRSLTDVAPRVATCSWSRWVALMRHVPVADKRAADLYSPAEWLPGATRGLRGLARVHAVVLDLDHVSGLDLQRVVQPRLRASGLRFLAYSTYSHAPRPPSSADPHDPGWEGSYRLILPLASPLPYEPAAWADLWARASWHLTGGLADSNCRDASHAYYRPSHPPAPEAQPVYFAADGAALSPSALPPVPAGVDVLAPRSQSAAPTVARLLSIGEELERSRTKKRAWAEPLQALALGRPFAPQGKRDDLAHALACELARRFPHESARGLTHAFLPSLAAMRAENPDGALTDEQVASKVERALASVRAEAEAARARVEAVSAPFLSVVSRLEPWEGDPDLLSAVLSDDTRLFVGAPDVLGGDEVSIAQHLLCTLGTPAASAHGATWLYRPDRGAWLPVADEELAAGARALARRPFTDDRGNKATLKLSTRTIRGVLEQLQGETARARDWFEAASPGVAFRSGFVDATLRPRPHDPCNRATVHVAGDFDAASDPPLWRQTVRDILQVTEATAEDHGVDAERETEEKVRALEEWIGVALLGASTRLGKAMVLVGPPGAGKSFLVNLVASLFPQELVSALQPQRFAEQYQVAELAGKALNAVAEGDTDAVRNIAAIKSTITGGDLLHSDVKYRSPIKFRARAGQLWAYNELPLFLDAAGALADRLVVLRCEHVLRGTARDDKDRAARLRPEIPAIVSRCLVAGVRALVRGNYAPPATSAAELRSWALASSPLQEFLAARCERVAPGSGSTLEELHGSYKAWCEEVSRDLRVRTPQSLALQLRTLGSRSAIEPRAEGRTARQKRWDWRTRSSAAAAPAPAEVVQSAVPGPVAPRAPWFVDAAPPAADRPPARSAPPPPPARSAPPPPPARSAPPPPPARSAPPPPPELAPEPALPALSWLAPASAAPLPPAPSPAAPPGPGSHRGAS
jgi:phage/plasmid-associated DNA primase